MKADWIRRLRGWWYRRYPLGHPKRRVGFMRRWNAEEIGFTQEGFWKLCRGKFFDKEPAGELLELSGGDGRVGSLGLWLERDRPDWKVRIWEHRTEPLLALRKNRPGAIIHEGRWAAGPVRETGKVGGVTSRDTRESSALLRAIRAGRIRPRIVGIWNPSERPLWMRRLKSLGYRLEIIHQRMEFYRDRQP